MYRQQRGRRTVDFGTFATIASVSGVCALVFVTCAEIKDRWKGRK